MRVPKLIGAWRPRSTRLVHFEIVGKDGAKLQSYYSELFGWEIDSNNPMNYGIVQREGNTNADGAGIGGGVAGGSRIMGPDDVMEGLVIGQFADPEGHVIGVVTYAS